MLQGSPASRPVGNHTLLQITEVACAGSEITPHRLHTPGFRTPSRKQTQYDWSISIFPYFEGNGIELLGVLQTTVVYMHTCAFLAGFRLAFDFIVQGTILFCRLM